MSLGPTNTLEAVGLAITECDPPLYISGFSFRTVPDGIAEADLLHLSARAFDPGTQRRK